MVRGLDGAALKPRWPLDRRLGLQSIPHHPRVVQCLGGAALTRAVPPHLDRRFSLRSHPLHTSSGAGSGAPSRIPLPVAALLAAREVPPLRFSAGGVSVAFQRRSLSSLRCVSAQEVPPLRFSAGGVSVAFQRRRLSSLRCVSAQEVSPLRFAQETVTNPIDASRRRRLQSNAGSFSAANHRRRNLRCELSLNSSAAIRRRDSSAKQRWRFLCMRATAGETSAALRRRDSSAKQRRRFLCCELSRENFRCALSLFPPSPKRSCHLVATLLPHVQPPAAYRPQKGCGSGAA